MPAARPPLVVPPRARGARRRVVRGGLVLVLGLGLVLATGACSAAPSDGAAVTTSTARGPVADARTATTAFADPPGTVRAGGRTGLAGFKEVTVTVVDAEGTTRTFCLLLADSQERREQGLMFVTDPTLGGYDGMLFAFDADTDGGFWMKNTRLRLSIAYLRADGTTTATTDMAPCPDTATTCPVYPPGGTYRSAIEVPQGALAKLGISDRSRVTIGARSCAPPA